MYSGNIKVSEVKGLAEEGRSSLFDPELPTASDVMVAICCVTTRYALNPSIDLAKLALRLAGNLSAPEIAKSEHLEEVARNLVTQWGSVLTEYQLMEASIMPQHDLLQ